METNVFKNLPDELKSSLELEDQALITLIQKHLSDPEKAKDITQGLIMGFEERSDDKRYDLFGQRALMLLRFYGADIPRGDRPKILNMLNECKEHSVLTAKLEGRLDLLDRSVKGYFYESSEPALRLVAESLGDGLADAYLNVSVGVRSYQLVEEFREMGKGEYIAEEFVDPGTKMHGIWMSKQGKHLEAEGQ